ncbi:hypothetical protein FRC18_010016 [Serendipita sp. 400]|nr:hypothetical protein FRC18_010016 [Serendipita sp. 400]
MTHHDRRQPSRNDTNSSWITIDWGKPQPPSKLHGVLDQIAGQILRDRKLIDQGKTEWRRALQYRRKKSAASRNKSGSSTPSKGKTLNRDPSRRGGRIAAGARKTSGSGKKASIGDLLGSLFGKTKATITSAPSSPPPGRKQTIRRAMTKPGADRTHRSTRPSGGVPARRPTGPQRKSSTRRQ